MIPLGDASRCPLGFPIVIMLIIAVNAPARGLGLNLKNDLAYPPIILFDFEKSEIKNEYATP